MHRSLALCLRRIATLALLAFVVVVPRIALADDAAPPVPSWDGVRLQLDMGFGICEFHRTNRPLYATGTNPPTYALARGTESGAQLAIEGHLHPDRLHGVFVGWAGGAGVFGPTVSLVHAGYSLRLGAAPRLQGVTADVLLDIGPAVGFVRKASESPDHVAYGGHVGVGAQVYFWNFHVGLRASYDGGYATSPGGGLDGVLMLTLDAGFAADVHRRR